MKLHLLIPSLRLASSLALANHQAGKLSANSALAVAFHTDNTPEIVFVPDTEKFQAPAGCIYAAVLLGQSLATVTDTIAGLELSHEQGVERMATVLLTNLSKFAYETKLADTPIIKFANLLDSFALDGIITGIANSQKVPPPPSLKPCLSPDRN